MRTKCEHCGRTLPVWPDTDGNGRLVGIPALCRCDAARWRRGECVDCGRRVDRANPKRLGKKRCPTHQARHDRRRKREHMARKYAERPEVERARFRVRYHTDEGYRAATRRRADEYRVLLRAERGRAA